MNYNKSSHESHYISPSQTQTSSGEHCPGLRGRRWVHFPSGDSLTLLDAIFAAVPVVSLQVVGRECSWVDTLFRRLAFSLVSAATVSRAPASESSSSGVSSPLFNSSSSAGPPAGNLFFLDFFRFGCGQKSLSGTSSSGQYLRWSSATSIVSPSGLSTCRIWAVLQSISTTRYGPWYGLANFLSGPDLSAGLKRNTLSPTRKRGGFALLS